MKRLSGKTDKPRAYLDAYERAFAELGMVDREVAVLELGIAFGGSLRMWRDYFPAGPACGVDSVKRVEINEPRIFPYYGDQADVSLLDRITAEHGPFDLIVDDASHLGSLTRTSFWFLYPCHLKPGGLYAIEDWGGGYWEGHQQITDGRHADPMVSYRAVEPGTPFPSHLYGTGGFVKQLIDEVAMPDITHPMYGVPPQRSSLIRELRISPGLVLVFKP